MALPTVEDLEREASKRGFKSLAQAARAARDFTGGIYMDPDAMRAYAAQRGKVSHWMGSAWRLFFAAFDLESEQLGVSTDG